MNQIAAGARLVELASQRKGQVAAENLRRLLSREVIQVGAEMEFGAKGKERESCLLPRKKAKRGEPASRTRLESPVGNNYHACLESTPETLEHLIDN